MNLTEIFRIETENELRQRITDIITQITKQRTDFSVLRQPYENVFPLKQEIGSNNTQSQIDELKEEIKNIKKSKLKKDNTKRGTKSKLEAVAEATEDIMNVLSNDVLPYTDDLKHLHKTNKEKARDTTLG